MPAEREFPPRPELRSPEKPVGLPAEGQASAQLEQLRQYCECQSQISRDLRACINEMALVFRFIESVSEFNSLDRILELLLQVIKELLPYEAAAVYLADRPGSGATRDQPLKRAFAPDAVRKAQRQLRIDEDLYRWVFRQGRPIVLPAGKPGAGARTRRRGSFMIVPLCTSTECIGRMEMVFRRSEGAFTQQTFSILGVLLKHAALIIAKERGYAQERETAHKYMELDKLKQDIMNTIMHEIKTPVTVIHANALMLRRSANSQQEAKKMLAAINRQCDRINHIVTQLFETTRLEEQRAATARQAVSLKEVTAEILRDLPYDPARIQFRVKFPPALAKVNADRASVYKIIRNLMENAVKYSPHGGRIDISGLQQGWNVVWQIKDRGLGVPEQEQGKIFDKFYRVGDSTTRSSSGMGFGLYIVKKNVELNGGSISVKSRVNEGTTFTLVLPKAARRRPRRG